MCLNQTRDHIMLIWTVCLICVLVLPVKLSPGISAVMLRQRPCVAGGSAVLSLSALHSWQLSQEGGEEETQLLIPRQERKDEGVCVAVFFGLINELC